jgi:hypothetical protein
MFELNPLRNNGKSQPQAALEVELRSTSSYIQWRYKGFNKWNDLISIRDLQGEKGHPGPKGEPGKDGQGIVGPQGIQGEPGPRGLPGERGPAGKDGQNGSDGIDGREIELRVSGKYIQWRYVGQDLWKNLIALEDLRGPKGDKGDKGERGEPGPQGPAGFSGSDGERGPQGPMGYTGPAGPQGDPGPNVTGGTSVPGSGDYLYQLFYDTDDGIMYIWDGSAWQVVGSGAGGNSGYRLAEEPDYQDDYVYVGYEHESNGSWFIYRRTIANNVREYASGSSDFATNWTGRSGLTYA